MNITIGYLLVIFILIIYACTTMTNGDPRTGVQR